MPADEGRATAGAAMTPDEVLKRIKNTSLVYQGDVNEAIRLALIGAGIYALIVHPDKPARIVRLDGPVEEPKSNDPKSRPQI